MSDSGDKSTKSKGFVRRHAAKLVASVVITAGIVFTLQKGGLTLVPEGGDFQHVRWWTLPVYVLMVAAMELLPRGPLAVSPALVRRRSPSGASSLSRGIGFRRDSC